MQALKTRAKRVFLHFACVFTRFLPSGWQGVVQGKGSGALESCSWPVRRRKMTGARSGDKKEVEHGAEMCVRAGALEH